MDVANYGFGPELNLKLKRLFSKRGGNDVLQN